MTKLRGVIGFLFGILGCYLLFRQLHITELRHTLAQANFLWLLYCIPFFYINMLLRAHRWILLFPRTGAPPFRTAFDTMIFGNFTNTFTPARGGDVLRAVLLGLRTGIPKTETFATVLVERVADLGMACLLMAAVVPFVSFEAAMRHGALLLGLGALIGIACIFAFGLLGEKKILNIMPRFLPHWWRDRFGRLLLRFVQGFRNITSPRYTLIFLLTTLLIWLLEGAFLWVVMKALGNMPSLIEIGALLLFSIFGAMIPGPPGQVGVFEYSVTIGATALGIANGAPLAVLWHGLSLLLIAVTGACISIRYRGKVHNESIASKPA